MFSVLHTLRSNEWVTACVNVAGSQCSPVTIHAPPVPWRLTGMPFCWATAPSWATADPLPRATARAKRVSLNNAHPALRAALATSVAAPEGKPARSRAGLSAWVTIASAVPSASDPIRKTTVLPLRKTPHASANTFGRPSNTKPTTPRPALRCCTLQPSWLISSTTASLDDAVSRHIRRPSTISDRIVSESSSRVVDRPRLRARSTSAALASKIGAKAWSSASRLANSS